jgi:secernin
VCDTLFVLGRERTLFAKNSDRPPHEAQVVEWHDRRPAGATLRTQYLTLPDAGAHALLGSRPTWLWGLEHGVNEHGVAVGNEKIWTVDDPRPLPPALLGMDLVRLALERATTADDALDAITSLLEQHGQGGSGEPEVDQPYFSSFLVADPRAAWIVETSARTWVARPVDEGAAISNRVTLGRDWSRASIDVEPGADFDAWRSPRVPTAIADHRLAATRAAVAMGADAIDARTVVATLRHHGNEPWGRPGDDDGASPSPLPDGPGEDGRGVTVCMHVRGVQATTASMVAELTSERAVSPRAWVALGSPCSSVYVPVFPPAVPVELRDAAQWARFARLRDRVEHDADALAEVRAKLAPVEAALWAEADALAAAGDPAALAAFAARAWRPVDAALARLAV